jgi:hypothetical protein
MLALLPASLLASGIAGLPGDLLEEIGNEPTQNPMATHFVSTNWLAAVRAALPAQYWNRDLTFDQLTNLLCQQTAKGNSAAEEPVGDCASGTEPITGRITGRTAVVTGFR